MANRHFGKIADVWKHLPLVEVLRVERPTTYGETHAGSAGYRLIDDPERRYGALRFLEVARTSPPLAASPYRGHLTQAMTDGAGPGTYPGSPLLAMLERRRGARYVLCDLDAGSVADIGQWANALGLGDRVEAIVADGMTTIASRFLADGAGGVLVHVDPYDPHARAPAGTSALELAGQLATAGVTVVYWYGYDTPDARAWAFERQRQAAASSWWCGDMLVTTADGATHADGDLGRATTPGTGFGIVCANLSRISRDRCGLLGRALAEAYAGVALPGGGAGALDFRVVS